MGLDNLLSGLLGAVVCGGLCMAAVMLQNPIESYRRRKEEESAIRGVYKPLEPR
jgi:hypothetical protein